MIQLIYHINNYIISYVTVVQHNCIMILYIIILYVMIILYHMTQYYIVS